MKPDDKRGGSETGQPVMTLRDKDSSSVSSPPPGPSALEALIAEWRKPRYFASELRDDAELRAVDRTMRFCADKLAALGPQPEALGCSCGEEHGMAVYVSTCANPYHAERANRAALGPPAPGPSEHEVYAVILEDAIHHVLHAYGDKGWAKSEMCRYLRAALIRARTALSLPPAPGPQQTAICWWCHQPPVGVCVENDEGTIYMCSSCATRVANFLAPPAPGSSEEGRCERVVKRLAAHLSAREDLFARMEPSDAKAEATKFHRSGELRLLRDVFIEALSLPPAPRAQGEPT